jgi:hypothetical protein
LKATTRTRPALLGRLAGMAAAPEGDLLQAITMTPAGAPHAAGMVARLLTAVAEVDGPNLGRPPPHRDDGMDA